VLFFVNFSQIETALILLESMTPWDKEETKLAIQLYMSFKPQKIEKAKLLLNSFQEEEKEYLSFLISFLEKEYVFWCHLQQYHTCCEQISGFKNRKEKRLVELSNVMLQVCQSHEQYEIAWELYENMSPFQKTQSLQSMIESGVKAFYKSLFLEIVNEEETKEEVIKWERRCW
jgi:hypothetical protein